MVLKRTSAVAEPRLTQRALERHARAAANRPETLRMRGQPASSEMDDSFPSTDHDGMVQMEEELDQILMDPEKRRDLLAAFKGDAEFFDVADTVKPRVRESIDLIDTRPAYAQPCFVPPRAPQVFPGQKKHGIGTRSISLTHGPRFTPHTIEAAEEPLRPSIDLGHDLARLIKPTSAQEDQLRNVLPSHFPPVRHVQNYGELGFYIDRSQYAISIGSGPVDDLQYGVIIVPFGEEHMLFRSEHESREVPLATQQESSLHSVNEIQPRIINSASQIAAQDSFTGPATVSKVHAPKRTRNRQERSSRITKTTRTRPSQTPAPIRRSLRSNAGRRTT